MCTLLAAASVASQGQTLERIAVFLGKPILNEDGTIARIEDQECFSHGQLYVALSRVGHPDQVQFTTSATVIFVCRQVRN